VKITLGKKGDYSVLNRAPSRISLLEVIEASEGPVKLKECVLRGIPCGRGGVCPVSKLLISRNLHYASLFLPQATRVFP
jgi:DNA-binding IscR family transcriptional regulator